MDVAEILDGAEGRRNGGCGDVFSFRAAQAEDQLFDPAFSQSVHSAQVCEDADARGVPLGRIPERFDDLNVSVGFLPALLSKDPDEHTTSIYICFLVNHKVYAVRTTRRQGKNGNFYAHSIGYPEIRGRWVLKFASLSTDRYRRYSVLPIIFLGRFAIFSRSSETISSRTD